MGGIGNEDRQWRLWNNNHDNVIYDHDTDSNANSTPSGMPDTNRGYV